MTEPYPIVEVQEEWALEKIPEDLGSKPKFWYRAEETGVNWLFKYSRENTGEHWSEKIAAEVADLLGVMHAKVDIATFDNSVGSVTKSFVRNETELVHGNQILARIMSDYDPYANFGQSQHTLANILAALDKAFVIPEAGEIAKRSFAGYLLLDALIGNTDRHHENWGILRRRYRGGLADILAPSFDHASSLGRELSDEGSRKKTRSWLLRESRIGPEYVEKGHGGVFWSENERRGPSPLQLVRLAIVEYPALFRTSIGRIERVNEDLLREVVERVPADWMSPSERLFAITQMCYNLYELNELRKAFQ